MARKNFWELIDGNIDIATEMERIEYLFSVESVSDTSLYNLAESHFRDWEYRHTFTSIGEMREHLGFPSGVILNKQKTFDVNSFLTYLEMIINFLKMPNLISQGYIGWFKDAQESQVRLIHQNISKCLEKLNQQIHSGSDGRCIIVEKNPAATAVTGLVDQQTAFKVIEYNHHALKGNLNRKREILLALADKFEAIGTLNGCEFKPTKEDVGYLLNKFNIRHNNKELGSKYHVKEIAEMSDAKLENWYDKTYDILLFAILADKIIDIKKDIKFFKSTLATN